MWDLRVQGCRGCISFVLIITTSQYTSTNEKMSRQIKIGTDALAKKGNEFPLSEVTC